MISIIPIKVIKVSIKRPLPRFGVRVAIAREPDNDPTPAADTIKPYPESPMPKTTFANRGANT